MEKNSKEGKKKKDQLVVVQSETELVNALTNNTPFQLGPSFTSVRIPFIYSAHNNSELLIKTLKKNTTVTSITFGRYCIWTEADVDALEKSLIANRSIHTLIFNYFSFKQSHKKFMKTLVKILTKNHRIQHVTFDIIDDSANNNIFELFCQNINRFGLKSLTITDLCHLHATAIFQTISNSSTITSIRVNFARQTLQTFSHMIEALMTNPKIIDLEIGSKDRIGREHCIKFKPVLERDHLKRLVIKDLDFDHMAAQEAFDEVMSVLQNSKNLEEFGFVFGNVNWKFLGDIISTNKSIKKLSLDCSNLKAFTNLKLDQNETLTEVSLINCYIVANNDLPEILTHNTTIKKLHYATNHLKRDEVDSFLHAFKNNTTLTDLQFEANCADSPLSGIFAEVLSANTSLRTLRFDFHYSESYETACNLIEALKVNTTLRELGLDKAHPIYIGSHNKPPGVPTFDLLVTDLLKVNKSLTAIHGTEEFPEITAALERNKEVQRTVITNGKMFVKMLAMRPKTYSIFPPEIWCLILRHVTVPGSGWDAEQFYKENLS